MLPEELARIKIDRQLNDAGWDIIARNEYLPDSTVAVKEALMKGNTESDYLLFIDGKAIAVVEAKKETNPLGVEVAAQAEFYSANPQAWYSLWINGKIPLVYLANGNKIYFKNMLIADSEYEELPSMHSPKRMLQMIGKASEYGALPRLEKKGLRDCQYNAEVALEASLKSGKKKALAILATGSGKTYLACLASYRLLNYTSVKRVLFLVDRNNLARQTESEFSLFDRTENGHALNALYQINRLKKADDINGQVVISTIQKLFAVLTGQSISDENEDAEDENQDRNNEKALKEIIKLDGDLKLPPDFFQLIIVDECHRSIYGKWKAVLDYFKDANVLGLTATPTPEAYAYFDNNVIEKYTYDDSVVDGVNVPARVYSIRTEATVHGGTINEGEKIVELTRRTGELEERTAKQRVDYAPTQLDRSVINKDQIETVLSTYRDAIYTDLYPYREAKWEYIPKTLIFAKDDNHATQIVECAKRVFAEKFPDGNLPEHFVQKITYSAGDSNALIRDLRGEKDFRIAVTVTLVATGTDVKPLEVVLFMSDVKSDILYTQMKGRGCRWISDDKLKEITPNAMTKECFYIVDAVGVTESDKHIPKPGGGTEPKKKTLMLEHLIEHLAHGDLSDENIALLRDYCASINRRYENNSLHGRHLDIFIEEFGYAPRTLANDINRALNDNSLPPFESASEDNSTRAGLVSCLVGNIKARNKLLEMQRGYYTFTPEKEDAVIYQGFSKESARSVVESFEKYIKENADSIEALRIIYNSESTIITNSMLVDLRDKLLAENRFFTPFSLWSNYKILDDNGVVEELDKKQNVNALTNLIQLVRYAYGKTAELSSLFSGCAQRFNLYCGQVQRTLTDTQKEIMRRIAAYVVNDGGFSVEDLNAFDTDLWRQGAREFGTTLTSEMKQLSKFILKVA
jgi:type I restriction-modification system, R subunit